MGIWAAILPDGLTTFSPICESFSNSPTVRALLISNKFNRKHASSHIHRYIEFLNLHQSQYCPSKFRLLPPGVESPLAYTQSTIFLCAGTVFKLDSSLPFQRAKTQSTLQHQERSTDYQISKLWANPHGEYGLWGKGTTSMCSILPSCFLE